MRAITDASVKNGRSTHSYCLTTWNGKVIAERKFNGLADRSTEAELNTIECLLKYCLDKGFNKIKIYSDCQRVVDAVNNGTNKGIDVTYLKHLLKVTNSKLRWTSRKNVTRCDRNCKNVGKRKFIKGKIVS